MTRILAGSAGTAVRRLFLFGILVFLGWCGLALVSGATASAAETSGTAPTQGSGSLLGGSAVSDVLDQATSAVRSVSNRPFDIVSVQQGDEQSTPSLGGKTARAGRTHRDEATRTTAGQAADRTGGTNRSVLGLVSVPVRGLADPGTSVPVDMAVSAVDRTLGHVADTPLRSVTGNLVRPLDDTVSRTAAGLAGARRVVPTRHDAVTAPEAGRAGLGTAAHAATHLSDAFAPAPASTDGTATELQAGPSAGGHHTPSAPAAGDAPAMPLGVAGGSAPSSGSGNAGASGAHLDFAGVRPSAASGPLWTVRQNDEQVPLDDQDRPRVSPD